MTRTKPITFEVNENGCYICTSHNPNGNGYPGGKKRINGELIHIGKWLYEQKHGITPKGMVLRHLCNEKMCINLDHLTVSTQRENLLDRVAAGTAPRGENNGGHKLTRRAVNYIRSSKLSATELSKILGAAPRTILDARNYVTWKDETPNCICEWSCHNMRLRECPKYCVCSCHKEVRE